MVNEKNDEVPTPAGEIDAAVAAPVVDTDAAADQVAGESASAQAETVADQAATAEVQEAAQPDEAAEAAASAEPAPKLVVPLSEMTPEERFRATTKLIFLAPDVPPVQPRPRRVDPRRGEFRQLDDLLDQRFQRDDEPQEREEREQQHSQRGSRRRDRSDRQERGDRQDRDNANDDDAPRRGQRQAPVVTEPQKVKGSTRLEAKKQRRRDGRDAGRRRMVITESEFLARREAVDREMIVRTTADRVQIGVLEDKVLVEHYVARSSESSLIGNVYLGRVQNVLPSMEAAFVDIGRGRNAVLYSGEVDWSEFEGGNTARRIENALKPGDQVLVQVTKDPVGHKGARLTSQISLPGRFLVYVPGGAMNGISRKLPDTERARLKKILKEVLPSGAGVIVRTAAEGATEDQLTHDVQRLTRQWESIQKRVAKGGGPVQLHSEPDMLIKIVRDVFNEDFHRMLISGEETYATIEDYLSQVAPDLMQRVKRHEGERDIFDEFRVTEQIAKALDRKVWLPSGGSLVIDRTEAMTVVDVNTGKFVGSGGNLEETVTKNNLEAAEEIVRQLRLRDIGGIIVVDFIDMVLESNRDLVLRRLVECLSRDRTKHQVAEVTSLGLVQMTRKKLGLGLLESFSEPCEVCAGRGVIVHHEPVTKHRSESASRGSKRGNNRGQNAQQHVAEKAQTHSITDGAKNMLAQVAASTIPVSKSTEDGEVETNEPTEQARDAEAAASRQPAQQAQGRGSRRESAKREPAASTGVTGKVQPRSQCSAESAQPAAAAPVNLLDSVLDALPDAPTAGTGRAKGRRVSTVTLRTAGNAAGGAKDQAASSGATGHGAGSASASAPAARGVAADGIDSAQAAQRALAEALDAAAAKRDEAHGA